ncbi:HAMP domain-containing sensor histidine kinase [Sphingomonas sp. CD22]|uniref:sensor histidine kinase n=1 Tax=Sphingomonas sp. CD22 TaxID=3100214 RepID=UPI002AE02418|nr:HAMP domain-containing sensor histidine kinase [Sphingomonas sp. CD22]MEA1086337.1 HAMP domain-containing sensor histidine kinase [Sphingomonas sp. CD22]
MSSTFRVDPRVRATWRWGGAIAALLVVQSLAVAAIVWVMVSGSHRREIDTALAGDCRFFARTSVGEQREELREMLTRDIHRDRFLALFDAGGRLIDGNVARLPDRAGTVRGSFVATVAPTELPGKASDVARLMLCPLPGGGHLLTGFDLDDAEDALRIVERALLLGLLPAVALAVGFGLVAGRRAARQVDTVRQVTGRIVAGSLGERLPVGDNPDSFGLLCAHINTMLDRIQSLVADVRGVGDDIAHQLRTPLTRLRAGVEREMRGADDRAAFQAASDAALAEIDQLLGIVAALLRIREFEDHARRSRFAPVPLAAVAEDACELYRPTAEDRGIDLRCEIATVGLVEGDASLLIEAMSNLIDNAIKFSPAKGRVTLSLAERPTGIVLTVADEGAGVPEAERVLVTQRFYRGRHECEGAGLGLALVKAIVDLHGFSLGFAATGSAVSIVAPLRQV